MIERLNKRKLSLLLGQTLPGSEAHYRMAPADRKVSPLGEDCKEAAVLLIIYPVKDHLHIVFMKRNEYDGPHSGQISFPGGMRERCDINLMSTAIRETEEEIGIKSSSFEILGALTPLFIPISKFCVQPFVAWMDESPVFKTDPKEVQLLICPGIDELTNPSIRKMGIFQGIRRQILTPYFDVKGERIWGATAMMLNEFIELID